MRHTTERVAARRGETRPQLAGGVWSGRIATDATDMSDKVMVTIPAIARDLQFGPCRWQSRDHITHPKRNNRCIVAFDQDDDPWVIAWWPLES